MHGGALRKQEEGSFRPSLVPLPPRLEPELSAGMARIGESRRARRARGEEVPAQMVRIPAADLARLSECAAVFEPADPPRAGTVAFFDATTAGDAGAG